MPLPGDFAMKTALHFALVAAIGLAAGSAVAAQESWVGKTIFTKKAGIKIGNTGDDGKQVYVAELKGLDYKVLGDKDGWLQVNDGRGDVGWFDKADAVPLEEAIGYFSERIRQEPTRANGYYERGRVWRLKGELDIAIKDFGEALRLELRQDASANIYTARGSAWNLKKAYDKAMSDYNEAIRLNPKLREAYNRRGNLWLTKKEYDKAITDYNEAIRLDPKHLVAYYNRGAAWSAKKDYDKAIADYNEAIRLDPKFVDAYYNRGNAWSAKKDYDKAIADYNEAIRVDPKFGSAYNARAWIWATCPDAKYRDGKKAIESAKQALALDAKSANAMDTLAAAYAEAGDFVEAVRWQEKALEDPSFKNNVNYRRRLELYRDKKPYRQE
jgi:tetratricopeptide (TPR) repeat protein